MIVLQVHAVFSKALDSWNIAEMFYKSGMCERKRPKHSDFFPLGFQVESPEEQQVRRCTKDTANI